MANSSTSSNSMAASTLGSSPLHRLASYFENARKHAGTISLSNHTLDTIKKYREQWSQHSEREVDAIVRALEPTSTDVCQRLDSIALVIICSILVHTESCLAQQRGLCLLAETLHGGETTSSQVIAERQGKKTATGQQALLPLIKGFTRNEHSDQTRRWMGVLALELLKDCAQNIALLQSDAPALQSLNGVIEHGKCQVLKLLAGSMIHTLLCAGVMPELIWPSKTDMELYSQFPTAEHYDTQWITAFEGFVEGLGLRNALTQQRSCVIFAFALFVGPSRYVTDQESAILVTVFEDLNIIIPNSATGPATYVDVPLDHIDLATIDSRANSQSQTPSHVLMMKLSNDDGTTCYLNASGNNSNTVALVFAAENDAKTLMRLMQSKAVGERKPRLYNRSEAIDISQAFSDKTSEDELAVLSLTNGQELGIMATQAASFPHRNPLPRASHSASQRLPTASQRLSSTVRPSKQLSNAAQYVERSVSVAMGVDVSQPAPLSNTQDNARSSRGPFIGGIVNQKILRDFERTSDTGLSSSLRWRKANDSIDNAPEFRNPESNVAEQQAAEVLSPQQQAKDYDSTYDVSPKNRRSRPDTSKLNALPAQPLRMPDGIIDDLHCTNPSVDPRCRGLMLVGPDAAAASKSQQSRRSKVSINVPGPPNTGDGSTDKAPPTKLSRGLRNVEGDIENGVGQLVNSEPQFSAEQTALAKTQSNILAKGKISAVAKTQRGVQKPVKPAKKQIVKKGKAPACADRLIDKGDEYYLNSSPEPNAPIEGSAKVTARSQLQASRGGNNKVKTKAARSSPKVSNLGSQAPPRAKASKSRPQNDDRPEKESIWGIPRLPGTESSRGPQREGSKQADAQALPAPKEKKASCPPAEPKPKPRSKPAPAAPMKPRSRRAAAIKANRKLQGLEESDGITDADKPNTKALAMRPSAVVEKIGNTSPATARIRKKVLEDEGTAQAPHVLQPRAQRHVLAEVAKTNAWVDTTHHEIRDSALESQIDTSSHEKVDLIQESLVPLRLLTYEDTRTKESLNLTDPAMPSLQNLTVPKDLTGEPELPANDDTADRDHRGPNQQPQQPCIPDNVSKFPDVVPDTEGSMASDVIPEHHVEQVQMGMIGDNEGSYFQEAMPETDGGSLHADQAQMSLNTAADVKGWDKSRIVQNLIHLEHPKAAADSRDNHNQAQDPFQAKLGPLVSKPKVSPGQYRAAQSSDNAQLAKNKKASQVKASNGIQGKPEPRLRKDRETEEAAKSLPVTTEVQNVALPNKKLSGPASASAPAPGGKPHRKSSRPASEERRSMGEDYRVQEKSVQTRARATNDAHNKANEKKQATSAETPLPIASLKTGLISWTVSGPRNQGTISAKRRISDNETHAKEPNEVIPPVKHDEKKEIAPALADPASWEDGHHAQRQILVHTTPLHNPKYVPPMIPEPNLSVIRERAHRLGSQSTKVDENGSPMPLVDQSRTGVHHAATHGVLEFASDDDEILAEEYNHHTYEPELPTVKEDNVPKINDLAFASMTSNRKQVPSSPHAPSTYATIPPHVVLHSGEMMNEKTLESIVPTLPQDPFVGGNPMPPSSFMDLLRKSTAAEESRKSEEYNKKRSSGAVKRKSLCEEDDPDITLVEPKPKRQKKRYYTHHESSSTSESTSRDNTPAGKLSDQESDSTTIRWQKTLEPHQANLHDVLSHITHRLVRHLIDKETAAKDIVDDYEKRGNNLLQGYIEGRRQDLERDRAGLELSKRKIAIMYTQIQAKVRKTSTDMSKICTRALGARAAQRHREQQGLESAIDRAIAACVKS